MDKLRDKIQLIKLEDLYIACLLGGAKKSGITGEYQVMIPQERLILLKRYLERYDLGNMFTFTVQEEKSQCILSFENTLVSARVYKEWVQDNNIIAISPMYLNLNVYILWISMFAQKRKSFIRLLNGHLSLEAKNTLALLFEEQTGISMTTNGMQFSIHDVNALILLAISTKRPNYEIHLFTQFISDREYAKLVRILNDRILTRRGLAYAHY